MKIIGTVHAINKSSADNNIINNNFIFLVSLKALRSFESLEDIYESMWCMRHNIRFYSLTLSDPTSNLVRQYNFPVSLRSRKTSDTVFVAFVRPLSEPVRRFSSCSTNFSQQIAQIILFLFLYVFSFKTVG
jgi:hypothetical protein